jgi:hypothetical protein
MAKLPEGIFGGFRGRIGNVIGVKRNGNYYIKSVPSQIKNPRTKKQQGNRNRFGLASTLASRLKPFIQQSFKSVEEKTWRGAFISYNMKSAIHISDDSPDVQYAELILSAGVLKQVSSAGVKLDGKGRIIVTWADNSGEGNAQKTDRVLLAAISDEAKHLCWSANEAVRADGSADLLLSDVMKDREVHLYMVMQSADVKMSSNTQYLGNLSV